MCPVDVQGKDLWACLLWKVCGKASVGNWELEMGTNLRGGNFWRVSL